MRIPSLTKVRHSIRHAVRYHKIEIATGGIGFIFIIIGDLVAAAFGFSMFLRFGVDLLILATTVFVVGRVHDYLQLKLYRTAVVPHDSLVAATLPKNWDDYFVLQARLAGLSSISYPNEGTSIAAYEVCAFRPSGILGSKNPVLFQKRDVDFQSPFVNRVDRSNVGKDGKNQFTSRQIEEFAKSADITLTDDPAVLVTGIERTDGQMIVNYYDDSADPEKRAHYFSIYVLSNSTEYMGRKFPREPDYPFFIIQNCLNSFKDGNYAILSKLPSILGVEVILVTKDDNKFVFQKRSSKTAIQRRTITSAVSAGYEPLDLKQPNPVLFGALREIKYELDLNENELDNIYLLGLFHVVPSNEFNFVVSVRTIFDFPTLMDTLRQRWPKEKWEYRSLFPVAADEVVNFSGKWKKRYTGYGPDIHRAVAALHYYKRQRIEGIGVPLGFTPSLKANQ